MVAAKMKALGVIGFSDHGMSQKRGGLRQHMANLMLIENMHKARTTHANRKTEER